LNGGRKKGWKGGEMKSNGRGAEGEENHFYPDLASIGKKKINRVNSFASTKC
jgi:hypothetical protein